jgi:hypothetical protein
VKTLVRVIQNQKPSVLTRPDSRSHETIMKENCRP